MSSPSAAIAIFKGERSGSTWLVRQLQALGRDHAYLSEETIGSARAVGIELKLR
jgi:hypothetical protein